MASGSDCLLRWDWKKEKTVGSEIERVVCTFNLVCPSDETMCRVKIFRLHSCLAHYRTLLEVSFLAILSRLFVVFQIDYADASAPRVKHPPTTSGRSDNSSSRHPSSVVLQEINSSSEVSIGTKETMCIISESAIKKKTFLTFVCYEASWKIA